MDRFHFKYQKILGVKERHEDMMKGKLNEARVELKSEKEKLKKLEYDQRGWMDTLTDHVKQGTNIEKLRKYHTYLSCVKRNIKHQSQAIKHCHEKLNQCKAQLMEASKQKKVFEKLRDKEKENFIYGQKKDEEYFVDQLVTFNNFKRS